MTQDALFDVEPPPFGLVPCCLFCGAYGEPVPVKGGAAAPWYEASLWCYLTLKRHEAECPGRPDDRAD